MTPIILAVTSGLVRAGMEHVLSAKKDYEIVASVSSFNELRTATREHSFATVILCSQLSGDATIESWRRLVRRYPDLMLLLWGKSFQDVLDFQCSIPQVDGYLLDNASSTELTDAMGTLSTGHMYVAASVAEYFARNPRSHVEKSVLDQLSERELQVTQMLGRGIRVAEIAEHLNISTKTVNTFRYRIFEKLGVVGDVALSHVAIKAGIVDIMNFETA